MHHSGKSPVVLGEAKEKSEFLCMHDIANAMRYTNLQISQTKLVVCSITPLARVAVNSNCLPLSPALYAQPCPTENNWEEKH